LLLLWFLLHEQYGNTPMKQTGQMGQRNKLILYLTDTLAITRLHSAIRQSLRLTQSDLVDTANHNVEHIAVLQPTTNHRQQYITHRQCTLFYCTHCTLTLLYCTTWKLTIFYCTPC